MSFGYYAPAERAGYVVNWDRRWSRPALDGSVRNLLPELLDEIVRFSRHALKDLEAGQLAGLSLGDYLGRQNIARDFIERYVIAMGSAIWSTAPQSLGAFPAESFLRFFANHGMLALTEAPQWLHIHGGSRCYVQAIVAGLPGAMHCRTPVERIERRSAGVVVQVRGEPSQHFDSVILAVHADEVLGLLANPTPEERAFFSAWRYERNEAVLHTDVSALPPDRNLWASWNYRDDGHAGKDTSLVVTYYLNRLQGLSEARRPYLLTLNPGQPIPAEHVLGRYRFTHPVYSGAALAGRSRWASLNGRGGIWYCGSYLGYGFHEDAVRSGVEAARGLGVEF
jgi:predicted NAD/FAD-binding protein